MAKKRISFDEALKKEDVHTYEEAQAIADEHKQLKASKKEDSTGAKKAGRKMDGKSLTKHKIAFYVNDEQLEYLEILTNRKERTPNAVAKKLFVRDYELHSKDNK
jgi:hypothetical protein